MSIISKEFFSIGPWRNNCLPTWNPFLEALQKILKKSVPMQIITIKMYIAAFLFPLGNNEILHSCIVTYVLVNNILPRHKTKNIRICLFCILLFWSQMHDTKQNRLHVTYLGIGDVTTLGTSKKWELRGSSAGEL